MFYKLEVQVLKDGSVASQPLANFTDIKDAEIAYHQAVAYNLQSDALSSFLIMIISEVGFVYEELKRYYNFAIEEAPENPETPDDPEPEGE